MLILKQNGPKTHMAEISNLIKIDCSDNMPNFTKTVISLFISKLAIVDNASPSILVRSRKAPSVTTGLRVIDVLFPVAQGQRELVIGDRKSGKSTVWLCSDHSRCSSKQRCCHSTQDAVCDLVRWFPMLYCSSIPQDA